MDRNFQPLFLVRIEAVAPLAGSVDRNICCLENKDQVHESLPSRGAWIEIRRLPSLHQDLVVAPLAGSVDRNGDIVDDAYWGSVAPLAGSVDRNACSDGSDVVFVASLPSRGAWIEIMLDLGPQWLDRVAPLAGSVDRNANAGNIEKLVGSRSPRGERG